MSDLSNQTILITGASRGIGAAMARVFSKAGAAIIPHAAAEGQASRSVAAQCGAEFLYEDLAVPGAGARLFDAALARAGRISAVVNNAGLYLPSPLEGEGWDEGWSKTLAVNLTAPADICRAAISHFRDSGGGRIVNLSSRAGHRGDGPDYAAYAASKGALLAMSKSWARALSGENILIYMLAPGWVETRMAPRDIAARAAAVSDIPLGRVAQPEEIANLAAFLLSDACPSAVGATFDINGASYVR